MSDFGSLVPGQGSGLHDMVGAGVDQLPGENALELGESLLKGCGYAVGGPEAYEAGIRMDVRVEDRGIEIYLRGHGWIVARKFYTECVNGVNVRMGRVDRHCGERGQS